MYLLELVETGQLKDNSYIPLRATTPQFLIDVVYEHSKGKVVVKDLPMASKVKHVAQNMEEDDGSSHGDERPHGFDKNDIVTISKEMGHPSYITLQENGRYAEVVSFYNSRRKRVIVAISFADDKNNFKHAHYMNGYNAGYYNIIVTQYEPDNFKSYLDGCEIVYDKQKMNGKYQVGSGRVVTFTHDTPFIDTVSNNVADVKQKIQTVLDSTSYNHAAQMESYTENKDSNPELAQRLYDSMMASPYAKEFKEYLRLTEELSRLEASAAGSYIERASLDDVSTEGISTPAEPAGNDGKDGEGTRDSYSVLPAKARDYVRRAENTLLKTMSEALSVPATARREFLAPMIRSITNEYLEKVLAKAAVYVLTKSFFVCYSSSKYKGGCFYEI